MKSWKTGCSNTVDFWQYSVYFSYTPGEVSKTFRCWWPAIPPKQFRPELEIYNLSVVRGLETEEVATVVDPHEVWEQYELGCPGVVATMLPELSEQQKQLLA